MREDGPDGVSGGNEPEFQDFVPVTTIDNAALVPLARSLLDSAGIRYFIRNERVQDLFGWGRLGPGYNVAAGAPMVTVEPSREDEARELLAKLNDSAAEAVDIGDAWKNPAPVDLGEPAHPIEVSEKRRPRWLFRIAIALGVLVLWIGWVRLSSIPEVRGLIHGTTEVVLESDVGSALRQELELGKARLAHALDARGISPRSIDSTTDAAIEVTGVRDADAATVEKILGELFPNWSRETVGSGSWRAEMTADVKQTVVRRALDDAEADLRERLAASLEGVEQSASGQLRLHIRVPGVRNLASVSRMFEPPTMLEIKRVRYPPGAQPPWYPPQTAEETVALFGGQLPTDVELIAQTQDDVDFYWPLSKVSVVVGRDLVQAFVSTSEWGDPAITFLLTEEAGERLESATRQSVGRKMALVLRTEDGSRVISAPVIHAAIRDSGVIEGGFTAESAQSTAAGLRAGSRPLFLTPVEVSASR
jgi:preprotein translocase subunit SecD